MANSQFTPKALDGCGLLCFPQTGGDFLQGKKPCGRIVSSLSLDDLCFRLFRHFDAAIFFFEKDITSWYLEECLVHVHDRAVSEVGFHWACELLGVYRDETCTYIVP